MRIRSGSGLGDSVYLRVVAEYFVRRGEKVTAMSFFPDVFVGSGAVVEKLNKARPVDILAHYSRDRLNQHSTQWQDILSCAKLPSDLPLRFDWKVRNRVLVDELIEQAAGDPIILVHGGRAPFGRSDGYGKSIMPTSEGFEAVLSAFSDCFTVRVGKGDQYPLPVGIDLSGSTTVSDVIDIASIADAVITQCGFPIPLAECFDKPALAVWAARGLASTDKVIASITPAKVLCKTSSTFVLDNRPAAKLHEQARFWRSTWEKVELQCAS